MSLDSDMSTCIHTRCHRCDTPVWIPINDYSDTRNYCYPCAMSKLGEVPSDKRTGNEI